LFTAVAQVFLLNIYIWFILAFLTVEYNFNSMARKIYLLSIITVFGILYACERDTNSDNSKERLAGKNIIFNNNSSALSNRISLKNQILNIEEVSTSMSKSYKEPPKVDLTKNYTFTLRAEVAPPVYDGNTLMATHVKIMDDFAFVTYNTKGDMYLGGLEVFDVSDISNPKIVWQAVFSKADVSSVDYYNNKLYIVGAQDVSSVPANKLRTPAILEVLSLNSNREIADVDTVLNLDSYAGTDVKVTPEGIYATSGSKGYLKLYSHSFDSLYAVAVNDARSIDVNTSSAYVFGGQPGKVTVLGRNNHQIENEYNTDGANTPESKSDFVVTDKYIFTALNEGGIKILNIDGSLKQYIPRPVTPAGKDDENYVTNSVSLNGDLLFAANGEAGIYIGGIVTSRHDSVFSLGAIKFAEGQSANFVESRDSIVFVATGLGGLKILSIGVDNGVPEVVIPTKNCPTLISDISSLFLEGKNNFVAMPELFLSTNTRNVILTKESEVYITFADEVAGWKNSLGYYTYSLSNPPTSIDQLEKHILFPNVSKVDEGGGLVSGDMVQIGGGKFPANTVIGFYLIAQGWKNGNVTDGIYTHYTNIEFNSGNNQQHTLFQIGSCNELVMTFEDISLSEKLSYTDNDFNDLIFVITDNKDSKHQTPSTAFDLTNIPKK
jgi:hypothetical protein